MKATHVGPIGLIALTALMPSAKAEQHQVSVTLVQTVKPTPHAYPGVTADILGIRIGMTVAQAEAIAAKTYPGKPREIRTFLSVNHDGIFAKSQSFISQVAFQNGTRDSVTVYFSNPTTGNVVYGIYRGAIFEGAMKQPLITAVMSDLIKKYGPASSTFGYEHWWQFGEQPLNPCNLQLCRRPGKNVVMGIYAQLNPGAGDHTKVMFLTMRMNDYQLRSESAAVGNSQLVTAAEAEKVTLAKQVVPAQAPTALTGIYVPIADTTPLVSELKENADNILDIAGAVTGRALVLECIGHVGATTSARAGSPILSFYALPKDVFQKYGLGPVTYNGKKYDMSIQAYGKPPSTTNVDVRLDPVDGKGGSISSDNTLVGGSVAIATAEGAEAFTFDHAVLKLKRSGAHGPSVPPNATVTVTGKAYCNGSHKAPLPQALRDKVPAGSLRFVSGTQVNVLAREGEEPLTYKINGNHVQLTGPHGSVSIAIDSHGCLDAPEHTILCKK